MSTPKAKPFKLKPSDGVMTRDDVSLWEYTLLAACRQVTEWQQFLPEGDYADWAATDTDTTNNLSVNNLIVRNADDNTVNAVATAAANTAATTKLRNDFKNFLTCVATHCPTGFMDTVMRESTSFTDIVGKIKTTYGLDSRGEKFLSCMDIKLEFSSSFTYEQGYMVVKDFFVSSLLPLGARFKGRALPAAEVLSPLAENFIMKEFPNYQNI